MRFLPKILGGLYRPVPLPTPSSEASAAPVVEQKLAALVARLGDRMIAAEAVTVAAHRERVDSLFTEFGRRLEDRQEDRNAHS